VSDLTLFKLGQLNSWPIFYVSVIGLLQDFFIIFKGFLRDIFMLSR
jgi:hypothetical protein